MVLLAQVLEMLFTFLAIVGLSISIDNLLESRRNINAVKTVPEFQNGRKVIAYQHRRNAIFSSIQYSLLIGVGISSVMMTVTTVSTFGMIVRIVLCLYVLLLMISNVMDMRDRRKLVYGKLKGKY